MLQKITHFEYEDSLLSSDDARFSSLLDGLLHMRFLVALSLPRCVDANLNVTMTTQLNSTLQKLGYLQRLNLSYCHLRGQLPVLLGQLRHHLVYLDLTDTRLTAEDVLFLLTARCTVYLRELTLSCNDLRLVDQPVLLLLRRLPALTCLALSHCQFSTHQQVLIATECWHRCSKLKVLNMHGYTPLSHGDTLELLSVCSKIRSMQKILLLPEVYGFPGSNERERESSRLETLRLGYRYLAMRDRHDIELE